MKVNGREIHFMRTVQATCDIADMCKDHNIENAATLFEGSYQDSQRAAAQFLAIMSKGYEDNKSFQEPGYEPHPLRPDEAMSLPEDVFSDLFVEAVHVYGGEKPTIETQPVKGKKKAESKSN